MPDVKLELPMLTAGAAAASFKPSTGLKKTVRCLEKALLRPGDGRGRTEGVCDVVRAMMIAKDMATVAAIAEAFVKLSKVKVVRIVRVKNRFATPSAGGWRDLMINFVIEAPGDDDDEGDVRKQHVCEVQVAHEMMLTARKGLPGHEIYAIVRNATELIESCGQESALRAEMVRAMREDAKATELEVVGAFEDAWLLDDEVWAEAAGGREALGKKCVKAVDELGRVQALDLSRCPCKSLPASVGRLKGLRELEMTECKALASVDLRATSIVSLGDRAFSGCSSLSAIELPAGLESLGNYAFLYCSSLSAIELPAGLKSLGNSAFQGCSSLSAIELPAGLESLGHRAFAGCSSLSAIELPAGLTDIGDGAIPDFVKVHRLSSDSISAAQ